MSAPMDDARNFHVIDAVPDRLKVSPPRSHRRWSGEAKARLIEASLAPGANVSAIAREAGLAPAAVMTPTSARACASALAACGSIARSPCRSWRPSPTAPWKPRSLPRTRPSVRARTSSPPSSGSWKSPATTHRWPGADTSWSTLPSAMSPASSKRAGTMRWSAWPPWSDESQSYRLCRRRAQRSIAPVCSSSLTICRRCGTHRRPIPGPSSGSFTSWFRRSCATSTRRPTRPCC
ncbi:MAG: hypothetical protein E5X74_27905 [Mesorhizobium sp.]|nr:MAG: hypothetical protein E5X74_27905 [Mesorhizobium sp.]